MLVLALRQLDRGERLGIRIDRLLDGDLTDPTGELDVFVGHPLDLLLRACLVPVEHLVAAPILRLVTGTALSPAEQQRPSRPPGVTRRTAACLLRPRDARRRGSPLGAAEPGGVDLVVAAALLQRREQLVDR